MNATETKRDIESNKVIADFKSKFASEIVTEQSVIELS